MNVPNHDKVPFKDMTPEERSAIVEAWIDCRAEVWNWSSDAWQNLYGFLAPGCSYRTKPRQLIIPWEHIKPEYKWAAMDSDYGLWVYDEKPHTVPLAWKSNGDLLSLEALNIDTTGIDWRESLVQRPEGM